MPVIVFNGKTYNSIEEMPANERQAFEQLSSIFVDKNGNGIPDFLEGDIAQNVISAFTSTVNYNGQSFNNMDELPPEIRGKVQGAFEKLSQMGIITGSSPMMSQMQTPRIGQEPSFNSAEPMISRNFSPTIEEDTGPNLKWILGGLSLILCLLAIVIGAILLLLR